MIPKQYACAVVDKKTVDSLYCQVRGVMTVIETNYQGSKKRFIETIVIDFNGTLAVDGVLVPGIKSKLMELSKLVKIVILTGDTYGTVEKQMAGTGVEIHRFINGDAGTMKRNYIIDRNPEATATIGNGYNDIMMSETASLSIAVIGDEGCYGKLLGRVDIVVMDIHKALDLFLHSTRIKATLNI